MSIERTSAPVVQEALLGQEHPFMFLARKSHKTHFRDRTSRSKYQPSNNTELLYDGSTEARAIISSALDSLEEFQSDAESCAVGILMRALDYLKGKDPNQYSAGVGPGTDQFSYTKALENLIATGNRSKESDEPTSGD